MGLLTEIEEDEEESGFIWGLEIGSSVLPTFVCDTGHITACMKQGVNWHLEERPRLEICIGW